MGFVEFAMWIFALPAGISAVYLILEHLRIRRIKRLEGEFPTFLNSMVEGLRSGESVESSLMAASETSTGPLRYLVGHMLDQITAGKSFEEALEEMGEQSGSKLIQRTVGILRISMEHGAELAETLDRVAQEVWGLYTLQTERDMMALKEARLLFMGAVIMAPAILGFVFGFFSKTGLAGGSGLVEHIVAFMAFFAFLSAIFYGVISGRMKMALIASPIYVFLAFVMYYIGTILFP